MNQILWNPLVLLSTTSYFFEYTRYRMSDLLLKVSACCVCWDKGHSSVSLQRHQMQTWTNLFLSFNVRTTWLMPLPVSEMMQNIFQELTYGLCLSPSTETSSFVFRCLLCISSLSNSLRETLKGKLFPVISAPCNYSSSGWLKVTKVSWDQN